MKRRITFNKFNEIKGLLDLYDCNDNFLCSLDINSKRLKLNPYQRRKLEMVESGKWKEVKLIIEEV